MADKYLKDEDEEYQFPSSEYIGHEEESHPEEEEETEGEFAPVPPKKTAADRLYVIKEKAIEHKRFVAICGIIVVVLIAFNVLRPHHKTQVISQTAMPPQQTVPQQMPATTAASVTPTAVAPEAQPIRTLTQPAVSEGQVNRLQENTAENQSNLDRLRHQMNDMQDELHKLQESQRVLNTNLTGLNGQLKELVVQLNTTGRPKRKPKIALEEIMPVYHLRALIPGRAWLEDDQGETLSVAIGDRLPGYGKVSQIDSQQGVVGTTSGRVIGFND